MINKIPRIYICFTGLLNFQQTVFSAIYWINITYLLALSYFWWKTDWIQLLAMNYCALVTLCLYSCVVYHFHCSCHINIHLYNFQWTFSKWLVSVNKSKCNGGTSGHNPAKKLQCSLRAKQIKGVSLLVAY